MPFATIFPLTKQVRLLRTRFAAIHCVFHYLVYKFVSLQSCFTYLLLLIGAFVPRTISRYDRTTSKCRKHSTRSTTADCVIPEFPMAATAGAARHLRALTHSCSLSCSMLYFALRSLLIAFPARSVALWTLESSNRLHLYLYVLAVRD